MCAKTFKSGMPLPEPPMRKSEQCLAFHYPHLYHEWFEELPTFDKPFGKKCRRPCVEAAIGIVRIFKLRGSVRDAD
jgi:hypothetical protein